MKTVGTNDEVARAWKEGRAFRNGRGTFRTDGRSLWSYDLEIGYTGRNGVKYLIGYYGVSVATTQHVGEARTVILERPTYSPASGDRIGEWRMWHPVVVKPNEQTRKEFKQVAEATADRIKMYDGDWRAG